MAAAVENGQRVVVVTGTPGELGTSDPATWPPERLAALRRRELAASLAALGVREHLWLGHRDGELTSVPEGVGIAQVAAVIDEVVPDTVVTFGPEGMTGHSDHKEISRWTTAALSRTGSGARLLHATTSGDFLDRFADVNERFNVYFAGEPPWTPSHLVAVEHRLDERLLDIKTAALRAQASQTAALVEQLGLDRYRQWCATEWFADGRAMEAARVA
jgi:LmbE family N-acetylglucosaminyl deacetylase